MLDAGLANQTAMWVNARNSECKSGHQAAVTLSFHQ
jgi:hypothetical protein